MEETGIQRLPEGCISHIISLTSPTDACKLAAVSTVFRSAADSDTVWEHFLPSDALEIVSRADRRVECSSTKELFFQLCNSILIDGGRKRFALEKSSGRKCFLVSSRDLTIIWGDSPKYWQWISVPDSRFSEVALLRNVCWLEFGGRINCQMLSKKTNYAIHVVFKITENSNGLNFPQQASIKIGAFTSERAVCLNPAMDDDQDPGERDGEWMKIEMGEFFCDDGEEGEVEFSLMEARGGHWKRGLLLEGIELRPSINI